MFAEDHFAVGNDVEDAAFALDQRCVNSGCFLDRFRQTGGFGCVVSLHAIFDADLHDLSLHSF